MKGYLNVKDLEKYKKPDLQLLAKQLGANDEGTIKELAARCAAIEVDVPEENEPAEAEQEEKQELKAAQGEETVTVKVIKRYHDKKTSKIKETGETFTADAKRARELVRAGVASILLGQ